MGIVDRIYNLKLLLLTMRKTLKRVLLLVVCALVAYLVYGVAVKTERIKTSRSQRQQLPEAVFTTLQNQAFTTRSLTEDSLVFVYYNPECGHCQDFGQSIQAAQPRFTQHQFVWVSPSTATQIVDFRDSLAQLTGTNHVFVRDTAGAFYAAFGFQTFPSVLVYHNKSLFISYQGDMKPELLLPQK
jgi:thiol-disulfide isomerase/thioredoxin